MKLDGLTRHRRPLGLAASSNVFAQRINAAFFAQAELDRRLKS
jgi:hypothetical protein